MDTLIGKTLGHYQVLSELGHGGMANVYKAWDAAANRHVALKILATQLAHDTNFLERFHREAKASARLSHPNIVRVHEVGQQDGLHYLVMDYIEGESLHHKLAREKRLSIEAATSIVNQIGSALEHAHAQGIIHRDVKPSNILLDDQGRAFLTDFGIAKAIAGTRLTQTGTSLGTPDYMSPEQVLGKTVDGRSDLYALGVVLYEMLTGQAPFAAETQQAVLYRHVYTPPPMITLLNPRLPQWVDALIQRALAKDPRERFQSGREMAVALRGGEGVATQVVARPARRAITNPVLIALAATAVLAIVSIVLLALLRESPGDVSKASQTVQAIAPLPTTTTQLITPTSPNRTITLYATPVSELLLVPANAEEGARFSAQASGTYRFTVKSGAVRHCGTGHGSDCETWTTDLAIYKNKEIEWTASSATCFAPTGKSYALGNSRRFSVATEAEKNVSGTFLDVSLERGDYVVILATDCKGAYRDNEGEIVISISPAGQLAAAPTPSRSMTPTPVPYFFDDFQSDMSSRPYDMTRWWLSPYRITENYTVVQENGRLRLSVTVGNQNSGGGVNVGPRQYQSVTLSKIGVFESKMMLASDIAGASQTDIQMQVQTREGMQVNWSVSADRQSQQPQARAGFFNCTTADRCAWDPIFYDAPIKYDEWHTYRIGANIEKGEFSFFLDGVNLGTLVATDEVWRTPTTNVTVGFYTHRNPNTAGTVYIDDVFISGTRGAKPPTPTPAPTLTRAP